MKVWVDNRRVPPPDWVWSWTPGGALAMLRTGLVECISLPPDQQQTSFEVVDWMADHCWPSSVLMHSRSSGIGKIRVWRPKSPEKDAESRP